MSSDRSRGGAQAQTRTSYTGARPDVRSQVPGHARRILDVGCSNGALGQSLIVRHPGRSVTGIDSSADFCDEARRVLSRVIHADINSFDWDSQLRGERFDCIIFADVLEHLVEPWRVLQQAVEFLEPQGSIIISVPNIRHLSALSSIFLQGTFPRRPRGIFDRTHLRWFTIADAQALARDAGLEIVALTSHLRVCDAPGGRLNEFVQRHFALLARFSLIREFLSYQLVIRAIRATHA